MEEFIALVVLALLTVPILAIILAIVAMSRTGDLRAQINRLTRKIEQLERTPGRSPGRTPTPGSTPAPETPTPPTAMSQLAESKRKRTATPPPESSASTDTPPPLPSRDDLVEQLAGAEKTDKPIELTDAVEDDERDSLLGTEIITERNEPSSSIPTAPPVKPKPPKPPRKPISFEELLSTKVIVWVAAVAVAMSGVFLVRYFVQQNLLEDWMKVSLAGLLGVGFIVAGEFARRMRYGMIGQGLVAAGIPVLYAAVLGSVQLYDLIPMTAGFGLLAAITVAAVVLSLRHGPLVALLGLIGGFLMPALIGAHHESAAVLFGYLFLLQIALLALARSRKWAWLTVLALLGGLVWAAGWIFFADEYGLLEQRGWVAMFLLSTVVAFVASTWRDRDENASVGTDMATLIGWLAVPAALVMSAVLVRVGEFTNLDWAQLGLMSAAALVMARLRSRYMPMPWIGAVVVAFLLMTWANMSGAPGIENQPGRFLVIVGAFGALFAGGAYACLWGSERPGVWAYLCGIAGIAYGILAYNFVDPDLLGAPWWIWSALGAGVYAALAIPVGARREEMGSTSGGAGGDRAMAGMIIASSFLASCAIWLGVGTLEGHPGLIAILWAMQMPVLAALAVRYKLADLHWATVAVAIVVGVRLLLNPNVFDYPIGTTPVWNWLLAGYGVPCIAFALTAWILRKHEDNTLRGLYEAGASVIGFAMVSLMVRHGFHPTTEGSSALGLYEVATYATTWGGLAVVLALLGAKFDRDVLRLGAVLSTVAMVALMFVPLVPLNPIVEPLDLGETVVFNGLLYIYGVPALMALAMGTMVLRTEGNVAAGRSLQSAGVVFAFAMVSLMIRHGFDPRFDVVDVSVFEWATYAAVWGGISVALGGVALFAKRPMIVGVSIVMLVLSMGATFLGPVLVANPLFHQVDVGATKIFNGLLYLYGLPVLIALVSARLVHHRGGDRATVVISGLCGLTLAFVLVTLQVRHAFLGPILEGPWPTDAEGYAYSAAWIGFALVLLAAALLLRSPIKTALRWSSLAVMLISVGKVFLYDTRELDDLWRVMSFLGLGVTLFAVAWVYQRYVFARRDGDEDEDEQDIDDNNADESSLLS